MSFAKQRDYHPDQLGYEFSSLCPSLKIRGEEGANLNNISSGDSKVFEVEQEEESVYPAEQTLEITKNYESKRPSSYNESRDGNSRRHSSRRRRSSKSRMSKKKNNIETAEFKLNNSINSQQKSQIVPNVTSPPESLMNTGIQDLDRPFTLREIMNLMGTQMNINTSHGQVSQQVSKSNGSKTPSQSQDQTLTDKTSSFINSNSRPESLQYSDQNANYRHECTPESKSNVVQHQNWTRDEYQPKIYNTSRHKEYTEELGSRISNPQNLKSSSTNNIMSKNIGYFHKAMNDRNENVNHNYLSRIAEPKSEILPPKPCSSCVSIVSSAFLDTFEKTIMKMFNPDTAECERAIHEIRTNVTEIK